MLSFHPDIFLIQWITFALAMAAIWAIYLKPLGKHLRSRREGIAKDLATAEEARAEAARLRAEFDAEKAKMIEENRQQYERVKTDAEAFRHDLMAKAKAEVDQLMSEGRKRLEQERLQAMRDIRQEAADLVVMATEKMIEKSLTGADHKKLADKFVKGLTVSKN